MPIGIAGQYSIKFSVAEHKRLKDFIEEDDLITFKLIEEAGNLLPIFELSFYTKSEEIFQVLHEGNDLLCTFGKDLEDATTSKLTVTFSNSSGSSQHKRAILLRGIFSAVPYITNSTMFISDYKSAIEVLIDKVSKNFGSTNVVSNVTKSDDKQIWIQPNSSDKKFVNELWLHTDLTGSFPAIGMSSDGKFIIKDIFKDVRAGDSTIKWSFVPQSVTGDKEISYDGNANIETNTGFINNWLGYGKELHELNLDTSFDERILEEAKPIIALSSKLAKRIEVEKRFAASNFKNKNTHDNYWRSYMKNLTHLASFQNIKVGLTFQNDYKPVKILDKVMFKNADTSGTGSSDFCSGVYYVGKVSRNITHRLFSTTVILYREAINNLKISN